MLHCLEHDLWPSRFIKNRGWLHAAEQARLLSSHALIAGCGGLGGNVALLLARVGIGEFTLCDHDTFCESNLNRQLSCREDRIGMGKALATAADIAAVASHAVIHPHPVAIDAANAPVFVDGVDVVLDCLDSIPARIMLERITLERGLPFIHAAIAGQEGFTMTRLPGQNPVLKNLHRDTSPKEKGAEERLGAPAATAAATAALQAAACCAALLGHGANGALVHLDLSVPEINRLLPDAPSG